MLWVSEGLTVYYEYLIMIRAGLMDGQKALDYLSRSIRSYENIEGKRHMSLQRSSYDIWLNFLSANENYKETAISYYDKGPIIGFLLDLEIRHKTENKKSLDDVMRYLYTEIYQKGNRGFTDDEFWSACEGIAGGSSLDEIKRYVTSTAEMDYQKYLDHAGLQIDLGPLEQGNNDGGLIKRKYALSKKNTANKLQKDIRKSLFRL
jgi:predicted metalloprotease with PDZ domain